MDGIYESLLAHLVNLCQKQYGDRLVSVSVYGSVGRGTPRTDSDIDLLIVAEGLPAGRLKRMAEFDSVEAGMKPLLEQARASGVTTELSPIIRMPEEVLRGSPLLLDMTEDARLLYDPKGFLQSALDQLRARLTRLGARRIWRGSAWYWDLNPDYKPGDVFEI